MTDRHVSDLCTLTILDPSCSPYVHASSRHAPLTKCIVLLIEMSSKSPGFLECQPRCLNLTVVNASHSKRMYKSHFRCLLESVTLGLFTSPSVNRCPFRLLSPVINPITILRQFLFKLSNSPAFLAGGFLTKPLACLCPRMVCQFFSSFPLVQSLIIRLANLQTFQVRARYCEWMSGALSGKLSSYFISIKARVSRHPYQSNPVTFCQF
jgi:hypothetical protein